MVILSESISKPPLITGKTILGIGFIVSTGLMIVPIAIALGSNTKPTGTYLSPLPENKLASTEVNTNRTDVQKQISIEEAILSSQAFLEKAVSVSKKTPQTEQDQQEIVSLLNQGLDLANRAVGISPNSPQAYLMRARILASSSNIRKDATILAQKDLEIAQALSNGQPVTLPTEIDLLKFTPTQQAQVGSQLVIASPEESSTTEASGSAKSNTQKSQATIAKGKGEITINSQAITIDSYVYLIPKDKNNIVYLKNKSEGKITVATDTLTSDVAFEYWIVNQDKTNP